MIIRGLCRGRNEWQAENRDFQGCMILYDIVMTDTCHYLFVKTHRMCNTEWTLKLTIRGEENSFFTILSSRLRLCNKRQINKRKMSRSWLTCTSHTLMGEIQGRSNSKRWLRIQTYRASSPKKNKFVEKWGESGSSSKGNNQWEGRKLMVDKSL